MLNPVNTGRLKNVFKTFFVRYGCPQDVSDHWESSLKLDICYIYYLGFKILRPRGKYSLKH